MFIKLILFLIIVAHATSNLQNDNYVLICSNVNCIIYWISDNNYFFLLKEKEPKELPKRRDKYDKLFF